jgi:hypothetical protein
MGLISGMVRTAVVAGTATAVSNRVTRRQRARWAAHDRSATPPPGMPVNHEMPEDDLASELDRLTVLHAQGRLTDAEFTAAKAKVLQR